jgi:thiol-disulfide isomerase/thioredoxin
MATKQNDLARAVDYYATAFAFPSKNPDPGHREEIRRKLGSYYLELYHTEKGLGDLILERYDELTRTLASRFKEQRAANADVRDPFEFVLQRPDGSPLPLAEYRGKVVVMDFWATWCAPCRVEGKLLKQVMERFRDEPRAAFLAVNVDENRERVPAFLKEEQWTIPVAYAQGLDRLLGPNGRVIYRQEGLDFTSFVETLEKKLRQALQQDSLAPTASR